MTTIDNVREFLENSKRLAILKLFEEMEPNKFENIYDIIKGIRNDPERKKQKNKERVLQHLQQTFICPICGKELKKSSKAKHMELHEGKSQKPKERQPSLKEQLAEEIGKQTAYIRNGKKEIIKQKKRIRDEEDKRPIDENNIKKLEKQLENLKKNINKSIDIKSELAQKLNSLQ